MSLVYRSVLLLFLLANSFLAFGQEDINNESFESKFVAQNGGGKVVFNGKSHAFSIDIVGKNVKLQGVAGTDNNQCFIDCDGEVIQTSWVPIPQPMPSAMHLSKLTKEQETEILSGYADYELDYFKSELKLKITDLKKEWLTINSKLYMVWYFDVKPLKTEHNDADNIVRQIYFSTVCFNQVVDLNMPIEKIEHTKAGIELLKKVAATLKFYNNRL